MANYSSLKSTIESVVRTNGEGAITGANMQSTLKTMIDSLGAKYQIVGVATASTNPGTPDYNVAYIAVTGSSTVTFTNFRNSGTALTLGANRVGILKYNGEWSIESAAFETAKPCIYSPNIDKSLPTHVYSAADARNAIPSNYQRLGLLLTYLASNSGDWVLEQYTSISQSGIASDACWTRIYPLGGSGPALSCVTVLTVLNSTGDPLLYTKSSSAAYTYTITIPAHTHFVYANADIDTGNEQITLTGYADSTNYYLILYYDDDRQDFYFDKYTSALGNLSYHWCYIVGAFMPNGFSTLADSLYTTSGF